MTGDLARRGDWMQTFTGRAFYPLDPRPEDVDPLDIARGLSMTCRYGGQVRRYYSVAEHSVLMARALPPRFALWALLHDAAEAYLGDMVTPLKRELPDYKVVEDRVMAAVRERFMLPGECPVEVKEADRRIVADERAVLMGPSPLPWKYHDGVDPLGVRIEGWPPARAEDEFKSMLGLAILRGEVEILEREGTR